MFSRDEIANLGLDQLSASELDPAVTAFLGFESLFGREWVLDYFHGGRSPLFVRAITGMWEDWMFIQPLEQSHQIAERWRGGLNEAGVQSEIKVIADLARMGVEVELFPEAAGKVPDCRVRPANDESWIYLEVSQRGLSAIRKRAQSVLHTVANAAAHAHAGSHGQVAILRMPNEEELERIVRWLANGLTSGQRLTDLAEFHLSSKDEALGPEDVIPLLVSKPQMFSTTVSFQDGVVAARGSAVVAVPDTGAQELLEAEASQLPRDSCGVVALDLTTVIGGIDEWTPLIERRFQPAINTRISAVILLSRALSTEGTVMKARLLVNPHARNPLSPAAVELLQAVVGKWHSTSQRTN